MTRPRSRLLSALEIPRTEGSEGLDLQLDLTLPLIGQIGVGRSRRPCAYQTRGIESPLGTVSTAVRMVAPGNKGEPAEGRRVTIWLSSYEQNDFQRLLNSTPDEVSLPISIDFLRRLETSQKTGRDYKQFHAIYRGPVERDSLPEVHEDQFKQDTPTPAE